MYGEVVLLFLAGLSFAAEESPTCGDGKEITLEIEDQGSAWLAPLALAFRRRRP